MMMMMSILLRISLIIDDVLVTTLDLIDDYKNDE